MLIDQPETNDVRERLQEIARTIDSMLPPGTGFCLLCFDFKPGGRTEYVSNAQRGDIVQMMVEWIKSTDNGRFGTHVTKSLGAPPKIEP